MSTTIHEGNRIAAIEYGQSSVHWVLRVVYFLVIGLPLSTFWAIAAWVISVTIIGLPFGLWMLARLPQITTLQPVRHDLVLNRAGEVYTRDTPQHHFLVRALYFVLVGWWFSALWLAVAWALSTSLIGLPIAFLMFNYVPAVMTLARS